ncbi:MAG: hypothetical protein D6732_13890 [Methanobacteriota archaeon]|nr:MAG: hypothetical protein D6732_13890 [Euryarchaeota archaeon]
MVPSLDVAFGNLRMILQEVAEALRGFSFDQVEEGFRILRDDSPEGGFFILNLEENANPISEGTLELIKDSKRVYVPSRFALTAAPILNDIGFSKTMQSLSIFHKQTGMDPLILDEILDTPLSVKTFSFSQRGKVERMYERLDLLPGLIKNTQKTFYSMKGVNSHSSIVERIPRALLHLFDGKFWVLEDYYENFLACAITVPTKFPNNEQGISVFYLLTPPDSFKPNYGNILLANIELQERCDSMLVYDEGDRQTVDTKFGFELVETFKMYVNF